MSSHIASVSHNLAIIHWTVPRVTYTPETYHVQYSPLTSENETTLLMKSPPIEGTTDLTAIDTEYDIVLKGLDSGTTYVANIVSNNTIEGRGQVSDNIVFETLPTGENIIEYPYCVSWVIYDGNAYSFYSVRYLSFGIND